MRVETGLSSRRGCQSADTGRTTSRGARENRRGVPRTDGRIRRGRRSTLCERKRIIIVVILLSSCRGRSHSSAPVPTTTQTDRFILFLFRFTLSPPLVYRVLVTVYTVTRTSLRGVFSGFETFGPRPPVSSCSVHDVLRSRENEFTFNPFPKLLAGRHPPARAIERTPRRERTTLPTTCYALRASPFYPANNFQLRLFSPFFFFFRGRPDVRRTFLHVLTRVYTRRYDCSRRVRVRYPSLQTTRNQYDALSVEKFNRSREDGERVAMTRV